MCQKVNCILLILIEKLPFISNKVKFSYNSKELFVEEVAMEYYKNQGYNAIWAENDYWWVIYALLFLDVIFMKTDTCTSVPMDNPRFEDSFIEVWVMQGRKPDKQGDWLTHNAWNTTYKRCCGVCGYDAML